jgi:gluconolactonase
MRKLFVTAISIASAFAADFEIKDEAAFRRLFPSGAKVERLATDMQFIEGPVWIARDGGYLIFSDIPANELKRWDPKTRKVTTYRNSSNNANGNTLDLDGNLVTAEHTAHRVSRTNLATGAVESLVEQFEGKDLNSPNDAVVKSDGTIWFTDPDYGLGMRKKVQTGNYVYRFDPKSKSLTPVVKDFDKPNGLCFSPDESKLYVADSGTPRHIRVFDVSKDGLNLTNGRVFAKIDKGGPDGIRCDASGRVWSSSGDGAQIFDPADGHLIARILLPESAANLTFGGDGLLYLTARKSLYAVPVKVKPAARPKAHRAKK